MDSGGVLRLHYSRLYCLSFRSRLFHPIDVHSLRTAALVGRVADAAPSLGTPRGNVPFAARCSHGQRGSAFPATSRLDYKAIEQAARRNREHPEKRKLGASTISQQTAKNVFLWPGRSWVRKGFEAYFTTLIEIFWSKQRIMEVYLNSIEMGDGIYGADAVAEWHFHCQAKDLTRSECALIAATLPNPRKFNSASPSSYMIKRRGQILHQMKFVPAFPKEGQDVKSK